MMSSKRMTKILFPDYSMIMAPDGNFEKGFLKCEELSGFKKDLPALPSREFVFMFILISNK